MAPLKQLKRDDNPKLRVILVTTVPGGAMRQNGIAYHPNGALYVILRPA
jgi:hypothetical protein